MESDPLRLVKCAWDPERQRLAPVYSFEIAQFVAMPTPEPLFCMGMEVQGDRLFAALSQLDTGPRRFPGSALLSADLSTGSISSITLLPEPQFLPRPRWGGIVSLPPLWQESIDSGRMVGVGGPDEGLLHLPLCDILWTRKLGKDGARRLLRYSAGNAAPVRLTNSLEPSKLVPTSCPVNPTIVFNNVCLRFPRGRGLFSFNKKLRAMRDAWALQNVSFQ